MMMNPFYIFKIKREERWPAVGALAYVVLWNVLVVCTYANSFFPLSNHYRSLVIKTFHISGFDPLSYVVLTRWCTGYNIYRHPLLAFFMYLPSQLNQVLIDLTGFNWASILMAIILVFCGFYSFILLRRIMREVVGLGPMDSTLLSALLFSFGYTTVTISVPDHFCLSMFMLLLTLYVAGRKMKAHHPFTKWQTVLFFIVTAGISLNNGIKVFLGNWFTNGKRFWRPTNLLVIIVSSLVIWGFARWEWKTFERPNYVARQVAKVKRHKKQEAKTYQQVADTMKTKDTALIRKTAMAIVAQKDSQKTARNNRKASVVHAGKPMGHGEFSQWTDVSTPRGWSLIENICGEPIQLHSDHLLGDVLVSRPVIVHYSYAINYVVEALVLLLFLAGVWVGRRSRFLWLALSFMGFDMVIHFILGFGLNEAYIMSAHWLFVIPIAVAYLFRSLHDRSLVTLRVFTLLLAVYLLIYNGVLYGQFLLG